jgi:hypothetical protein
MRLFFDLDAFLISSKFVSKILESIGLKNAAHVRLVTSFNFSSVNLVSTRLMMRLRQEKRFLNPLNGKLYGCSDLSCMPQVEVAQVTISEIVFIRKAKSILVSAYWIITTVFLSLCSVFCDKYFFCSCHHSFLDPNSKSARYRAP